MRYLRLRYLISFALIRDSCAMIFAVLFKRHSIFDERDDNGNRKRNVRAKKRNMFGNGLSNSRIEIGPLTAIHSYADAIVTEILYRINNIISYLMFHGCNGFEKQRAIWAVIFLEISEVLRLHNFVSKAIGEREREKNVRSKN